MSNLKEEQRWNTVSLDLYCLSWILNQTASPVHVMTTFKFAFVRQLIVKKLPLDRKRSQAPQNRWPPRGNENNFFPYTKKNIYKSVRFSITVSQDLVSYLVFMMGRMIMVHLHFNFVVTWMNTAKHLLSTAVG